MKYRPDIDGLRALAVAAVVLFHAGVPHLTGGFTGVDIFFVISGYLITQNIAAAMAAGQFSMAAFYERRVRRIFPALMVMLGVVILAACAVLLPQPLRMFGDSLYSAVIFGANIYFHGKTGYFDGVAADKPLLHVWSLAVEEQFYFVFPLVLAAIGWLAWKWKFAGKASLATPLTAWVLLGLVGASFIAAVLAVAGIGGTANDAFYLTAYRAWELGMGAGIALLPLPKLRHGRVQEGLAVLGLALMLAGIVGLDKETPFPGMAALLPCMGAALVIYTGQFGVTQVGHILSWRPVVAVGLVSYSLYLWHWPLLVLPQQWHVLPLDAGVRGGLVVAAVVMAALSWRLVEIPVRRKQVLKTRRAVFVAAGVAMMVMFGAGLGLSKSGGWPERLPEEVRELDDARLSQNPRLRECFRLNDKRDDRSLTPAKACAYGADVTPTWALWGDSHADALISPLGDVAKAEGVAVRFYGMSGCPPLLGINLETPARTKLCDDFNDEVMRILEQSRTIDTVVLMARWAGYTLAYDADAMPAAKAARTAMVGQHLQAVIDRLLASGKRVVIVHPVPETGVDTPSMLAALALRGLAPESFTTPLARHRARTEQVRAMLRGLHDTQGTGRLVRIHPRQVLCPVDTCFTIMGHQPLYYDNHHLSLAGGALVAKELVPYFKGTPADPLPKP